MMKVFKKILVPVDGSKHSKKSLLYAEELAKKFHSSITILHVYELPLQIIGYEYSDKISQNIKNDLEKNAQNIIDRLVKEMADPSIEVEKVLLVGNQGLQITNYAQKEKFDLIVLGSKGLSNIESFLIGSVANYVVHHTDTPILMIN